MNKKKPRQAASVIITNHRQQENFPELHVSKNCSELEGKFFLFHGSDRSKLTGFLILWRGSLAVKVDQ